MLAAVVLTGVTVLVNVQSARANSATWDESLYMFLGRTNLVEDYRRGFAELGVAPLPVHVLWTRSVLEPIALEHTDAGVFAGRVDRARRRAIVLVAVPLVLCVLLWAALRHRLLAGIAAASIVALSPNVIAHSSLATTDAAFTLAFLVAVAALIGYVSERSWPRALMLAFALGTALATKYSAIILFAVCVVMFALRWRERRIGRDLTVLVAALVVAWGWHGWALMPINHLGNVPAPILVKGIAAQAYLDRGGQEAFLLGQVSQHGWWYFFPVVIALKSTIVELVALGAFLTLAARRGLRDPETQVIVIAVVAFVGVAMLGHRDLGMRYVLAPFVLAVVAGMAWAVQAMGDRRHAVAAMTVLVLGQAAACASIAPQHLAYLNELAGGPSSGYTKVVDSNLDWGQDLLRLRDWQAAHAGARVGVAYFGSAPLAAYSVRVADWRSLLDDHGRADVFVISATYLQGVFLCGDPFAPLRAVRPSERIGYTLFSYAMSREDVRAALAEAARDRCAP